MTFLPKGRNVPCDRGDCPQLPMPSWRRSWPRGWSRSDQLGLIQEAYAQKIYRSSVRAASAEFYRVAPLQAHKEEYIYYRTDHHWTTLRAPIMPMPS